MAREPYKIPPRIKTQMSLMGVRTIGWIYIGIAVLIAGLVVFLHPARHMGGWGFRLAFALILVAGTFQYNREDDLRAMLRRYKYQRKHGKITRWEREH